MLQFTTKSPITSATAVLSVLLLLPYVALAASAQTNPETETLVAAPRPAKYETSLVAALKVSAEKKIPILLVLVSGDAAAVDSEVKKLLADDAIASAAPARLTVVPLSLPSVMVSGGDELAAYRKIADKYRVRNLPLQYLLLDSTTDNLLYKTEKALDDPKFAAALEKSLPKDESETADLLAGLPAINEAGWYVNYRKAVAASKDSKKPLLLLFTGSDWCPWCKKLESEVLSTDEFKTWMSANLVPVYLDFPRFHKLPDAQAKQNDELNAAYKVTGYPTTIIVSADGKELDRIAGFLTAGTKAYIRRFTAVITGTEPPGRRRSDM